MRATIDRDEFLRSGYGVVRPLFEPADFREIRRVVRESAPHEPCLWAKDLAAADANMLNIATHPAIVRILAPLLGENIVLWGASCLERAPGQVHPWHTDIESSRPAGGFASVWIGLEGTTRASALKLVPGSHAFGRPLQEVMHAGGATRERVTDEDVRAWARRIDPATGEIAQPALCDGEATLRYDDGTGTIADHRVGAGDGVYYPAFHRHTIHNHGAAPVVYLMFKWIAPRSGTEQPLGLQRFTVDPLRGSTAADSAFATRECFTGATHHLKRLHAHVSTLLPQGGYDAHADEHDVALLVVEGTVRTLDRAVTAGEWVWYAAGEPHGMLNPGPDPARYIVFEFHGDGCSGDYAAYTPPAPPSRLFKRRDLARIARNLRRIVGIRG